MLEPVGKPMTAAAAAVAVAAGVTTAQRFTLALNNKISVSGGKPRAKTGEAQRGSGSKVEKPRRTFNGSALRYELDDSHGHQEYLEKAQYHRSK